MKPTKRFETLNTIWERAIASASSVTRHCLLCGYIWLPRVPNPRKCPECNRKDWNKPRANKGKSK